MCFGILVSVVHFVHRPFWTYYMVHLAAGFVPIAGWAIAELGYRTFGRAGSPEQTWFSSHLQLMRVMVWTGVLSLWLAIDGTRAVGAFGTLLRIGRAQSDEIVYLLRSVASQVTWAYSRDNSVISQARLLMIPELTILAQKRFWAGYIREEQIIDLVKRYRPEVLVLSRSEEEKDLRWKPVLHPFYRNVLETDRNIVYFANSLQSPALLSSRDRLKRLGL